MKIIRLSILMFFFFLLFENSGFSLIASNIPDGISIAFKAGNSKALAKFFNTEIELVILDKEDVYSKAQAELIIKDFFSKHSPTNFLILHQGGKEGAKYAIGNLTTTNGTFRVYFLLKTQYDQPFIHQLRIEKEDD